MLRKTISLITLAVLMVNMMGLTGCTKISRLSAEEVRGDDDLRGSEIILCTVQDTIEFNKSTLTLDTTTRTFMGRSKSHGIVVIPLEDVLEIQTKRSRWTRTALPFLALTMLPYLVLYLGGNALGIIEG